MQLDIEPPCLININIKQKWKKKEKRKQKINYYTQPKYAYRKIKPNLKTLTSREHSSSDVIEGNWNPSE